MLILVVALVSGIAAWRLYRYFARVLSIPLYSSKNAVLCASHDLDAGGTFKKRLDIDAIAIKTYLSLLVMRSRADRIFTLVTLSQEKSSAHSPWTVAIKLGNRTMGHLSGEDTYQLRLAQKKRGLSAQHLTCPAAITGRHTKNYGIWLDLPGAAVPASEMQS